MTVPRGFFAYLFFNSKKASANGIGKQGRFHKSDPVFNLYCFNYCPKCFLSDLGRSRLRKGASEDKLDGTEYIFGEHKKSFISF